MSVAFVAPCPVCCHDAAWREEESRPEWDGFGWSQLPSGIQIDCHTCEQETP